MEEKVKTIYMEKVKKAIDDGIITIISSKWHKRGKLIPYEYDKHLLVSNYWYFKDVMPDSIFPIKCIRGCDIIDIFRIEDSLLCVTDMDKVENDKLYCMVETFDSKMLAFVEVHFDGEYLKDMPHLSDVYYIGAGGTCKLYYTRINGICEPNNEHCKMDMDYTMLKAWDKTNAEHCFSDILKYICTDYKYYNNYICNLDKYCNYEMKLISEFNNGFNYYNKLAILAKQKIFSSCIQMYSDAVNKFDNANVYIEMADNNRLVRTYNMLLDILSYIIYNFKDKLIESALCNEDGSLKKNNITTCSNANDICDKILDAYEDLLNKTSVRRTGSDVKIKI